MTPVGSFKPNGWGLYDMHGNVWEWCWDWYGDYPNGEQTDSAGASSGTRRMLRGGGWRSDAQDLRSAYRGSLNPDYRNYDFGFRVVCPFASQFSRKRKLQGGGSGAAGGGV